MRKLVLLAGLVYLCSCSKQDVSANGEGPRLVGDRKPAPEFTLKDENGATVRLSDYRGKVVLLNFWATWCGPCVVEIPWFQEFEQKYKARGFAVLAVSMDEDGWAAVRPFIAERKINYRVLLGNDSMAQFYGGLDSLPTNFLVDREGKIAFPPHIGLVSKNDYVNEIECLLRPAGSGTSAHAACPTT